MAKDIKYSANEIMPPLSFLSFAKGRGRLRIKYKNEYELTSIQKEALIGIILGDGFLERGKSTHNTRIRIEQSYPEKSEYLKSLYKLLEPWLLWNLLY